jgi:hypothetical protein
MKQLQTVSFLLSAAMLFTTGCTQQRAYYAPAPLPPPSPGSVPPLVEQAEHNGFRTGVDDGARDAYNGFGYHPKHDRNFHETPGYDPRFGPFGPYQNYFRGAYLRGYDKGFYRR